MAVVLSLVPPFLLLRSSHGSHTRPCSVAIKSDDCCRSLLAIVINMTLPRLLRKVSVFAHTIESIHGPWQICGHGAVVGCNSWARPPSFVPSIVTALYVQLDCRSDIRPRIINLASNQKGYDNSETTVGKLSARRIQIFWVYFSVIIFDLFFSN